jgi:GMP synthase-like glutamine amidotransferase
LVVQNDRDKSLGTVADGLIRAGLRLDVRSPAHELPSVAGYAALVVLPGLADPVDQDPPVIRAREAIAEALAEDLPVLGLCLGGQLLVQALGGSVYQCQPELGFGDVFVSPSASSDPLLSGAPERFSVFHAHTYAFEPPAQAEVLLTNDVCVQACRHGNTWAFQCHPEITRQWATALASGLRGQNGELLPETTDFFRRNGVTAEQIERDSQSADQVLGRLAAEIGAGFAASVS